MEASGFGGPQASQSSRSVGSTKPRLEDSHFNITLAARFILRSTILISQLSHLKYNPYSPKKPHRSSFTTTFQPTTHRDLHDVFLYCGVSWLGSPPQLYYRHGYHATKSQAKRHALTNKTGLVSGPSIKKMLLAICRSHTSSHALIRQS